MVDIRIVILVISCLFIASFTFGCADVEETEPEETETEEAGPTEAEIEEIEPDGLSLYRHITEEDNYKNWSLWPGKGEMYNGTEPHGALITVYVTDNAHSAIEGKAGIMPEESIILKENYNPEKQLLAITVMYKEKDYDPKHNDWFWVKYSANGTVEAEGKVEGCIQCHEGSKDNDYIFTGNLT
ncbi:MAG: cytochrome P460 family protein [Methanosarcinales archaeon]|nr:cytochrome P460 family protein [Methanosarcinales archaeon]